MNSTYSCSCCRKDLPPEAFSKKQINKFQHGHAQHVTCAKCIHDKIAVEEQPSSSKPIEHILQQSIKPDDPSMMYINEPLEAPLIKQAREHFRSNYNQPIEIAIKSKFEWRSHVKIAVRSVLIKKKKKKTPEQALSKEIEKVIKTRIGLFKPGSHDVIECLDSPAHYRVINRSLVFINKAIQMANIHGYMEGQEYNAEELAKHNTYIKYLVMSIERSTDRVQLTIVVNAPKEDIRCKSVLTRLIQILTHQNPSDVIFHSIWINHHVTSKHDNSITGRDRDNWVLHYGEEYLLENCAIYSSSSPWQGMRLHFLPFVFRQANIDAFADIIRRISSSTKEFTTTHQLSLVSCLELYGGIGTIGLHLLDAIHRLHCSDENPFNQICFEKSRHLVEDKLGNKQEVQYYPFSAEKMIARSDVMHNLTVAKDNNNYYDLIIVDPPRKGLDSTVLQGLIASSSIKKDAPSWPTSSANKKIRFDLDPTDGPDGIPTLTTTLTTTPTTTPTVTQLLSPRITARPQRLVYVSCGFEALKRDLAVLTNNISSVDDSLSSANVAVLKPHDSKRKRSFQQLDAQTDGRDSTQEGNNVGNFWTISEVFGYVLFPGADHLETLVLLDRTVPV